MTMLVNSSPRRAENDLSNVFVQSGLGRDSYLYGIGFYQVSSSRLPITDDMFQFISAARRTQCYHYEALSYNLVYVVIRCVMV